MKISVNGTELYYEVKGKGQPLILTHGNGIAGMNHTTFNEAIEQLKDHFTCYAIDSRGQGQSQKVDYLNYEMMAEDMIQFMDQLDLRDVVFYGYSDGANIGMIAAQKTDRISKLILSGPMTNPEGCKNFITRIFKFIYFFKKSPLIRLMLEEPHISNEDLHKIKVPTLVTAGSNDIIYEDHIRNIAENIPNSTLKILQGEGHGSYIEHSPKVADLIMEFVCEE